jgi:hypothetical protein
MLPSAEYVKEAVAEDNAGNYQRAFELYKIALEYFGTHLKYEKNARARETITAKAGAPLTLHTPPASQFLPLPPPHQWPSCTI